MLQTQKPTHDEMDQAMRHRDASYEGLFVTAVRTTGIFCRPTCPAKKPRPENVEFYFSVADALASGYRPCKRCRPLQAAGQVPDGLAELLDAVDSEPARRWTDADLREWGLEPSAVRRWFKANHGMTFHAYHRARRLGMALGTLRHGADLTQAGFAHGYESSSGFREAFQRLFGQPPGRGRAAQLVVVNRLASPLGPLVAAATKEALCLLEFADRRMLETQIRRLQQRLGCTLTPGSNAVLTRTQQQLDEYFDGRRMTFDLPWVLPGTEFQRQVWDALLRIPCGETQSYEGLARSIGRPGAQRAVGRANGDNRLAILVPCHRVVRRDGTLCGYGGGLHRKEWLLDHERRMATQRAEQPRRDVSIPVMKAVARPPR